MREIQHVGRLLRKLHHAIRLDMQKQNESLGLTSSQGFVLGYLTSRALTGDEPIYAKDVEHYFHVRHSSVSGVLQRLEAKGFITFSQSEADHRCKTILLTPKAYAVHEKNLSHIRETEDRIFSGMSEAEQETFLRLLRKAAENLTGSSDDPPPFFAAAQTDPGN
ncbi:MAG: MarR family winged helix-turn-helix transcriptional regulator [Oscillospiraceae bacterium]|nr:MarR family winged helix-turn-helix transcriptional regulator [Oscillospiraceae bacterium]